MSFDKYFPNRKDRRKTYKKKAQQLDRSCRCHGSCPWCQGNRTYKNKKRIQSIEDELSTLECKNNHVFDDERGER